MTTPADTTALPREPATVERRHREAVLERWYTGEDWRQWRTARAWVEKGDVDSERFMVDFVVKAAQLAADFEARGRAEAEAERHGVWEACCDAAAARADNLRWTDDRNIAHSLVEGVRAENHYPAKPAEKGIVTP